MPTDPRLKAKIKTLEIRLEKSEKALSTSKATITTQSNQINTLATNNNKLNGNIRGLRHEISSLTSEKEALTEKLEQATLKKIKPTPSHLVDSFRLAMDDLNETLAHKPGSRVGYTVSQFDIDLKAAITIDTNDNKIRFELPELGKQVAADSLSNIKFTVATIPTSEFAETDLIEIPSLLGLSHETAKEVLFSKGLLEGKISQLISKYPPGTVVQQSPDNGDFVPPNSRVNLGVAKSATVKVPVLTGKSRQDAQLILSDNSLRIGTVTEENNPAPKGTVLSQNPKEGIESPVNSVVHITVAKHDQITMPNLVGKKRQEVKAILKDAHLQLGSVESKNIPDKENETVLDQTPKKGAHVAINTLVTLLINKHEPRVKVPNLTTKSLETARRILNTSHLKVGRISKRSHPRLNNVVLQQVPVAETMVDSGTAVSLVIAKRTIMRDLFATMENHPDIRETGFTFKTLQSRFSSAKIDTVEKFEELATQPAKDVATLLQLRNKTKAPETVKKIIQESLEDKPSNGEENDT